MNPADVVPSRFGVMSRGGAAATPAALTVTLGIAAASWVVAVRQMGGMDMGVATEGSPYVPLALAIIGLGILIIVAPSTIPGLMPAM